MVAAEASRKKTGRPQPASHLVSACDVCTEFPASLQISRVTEKSYCKPLSTNCRSTCISDAQILFDSCRRGALDKHWRRITTLRINQLKCTTAMETKTERLVTG